MFGLAERGRLAMYSSTLAQAKHDAQDFGLFHSAGLMLGVSALSQAIKVASAGSASLTKLNSLNEAIESVPSAYLSKIDLLLLRAIEPPKTPDEMPSYQMPTLVNGLIFVRILEVARPRLAKKGYEFRDDAILFMEPLFSKGMAIMSAKYTS